MNEDKRAEKAAVIAEAAYRLLAERGFAGTSMLAVAKAAKASNETLYKWYGDKTGLFRELVLRNAGDTADRLAAGLAGTRGPLEILERSGAELLAMLLGPRAVALNRAAAADATGTLGPLIAAGGRERIAPLIARLLARAVAEGRLEGDPGEMTETYLALLIGDSQIRRVIGTLPPPDADACAARARAAVAALVRLHPSGTGEPPGLWTQPAGPTRCEGDRRRAMANETKPPLTLFLAAPRGFCAGVDRAIKIVEMAIEKWGAPIYVRHEIVHNKFVVDGLREKGAVFVEELDECPADRPVIFSAHGVPKSVPAEAAERRMVYVDATCPLVSKVHIEAERHHEDGLQMVMIGHAGHPETIGTMGQLPEGEVLLVETAADVASLAPRDPERLAYITQTTLSVDDTKDIVAALKARFPAIVGPHKEDICYATTNRQEAVKAIAPKVEALLVIGSPNSSNSRRLVEVARSRGCAYAQLVGNAGEIDWRALDGIATVGVTAGASAPELLVDEVVAAFRDRYAVTVETVETARESVEFKVPRVLREEA